MATQSLPRVRWRHDRLFYTSMGLFSALIVFIGFAPSYYLSPWFKTPVGTPEITTLLHIHGAFFTAWIALSIVQPALIAGGARPLHRTIGYAGAGLAAVIVLLGTYAAARAMHGGFIGLGDTRVFFAIPFFAMVTFAAIVALGVKWRNRPETHKRLMLLANTQIIEAAVARICLAAGMPLPPLFFVGADLIIVAGIGYDLLSRGKVHNVWKYGGALVVLSQVFRVAISGTQPWIAFADAVKATV
jgi:hypothetical protein